MKRNKKRKEKIKKKKTHNLALLNAYLFKRISQSKSN